MDKTPCLNCKDRKVGCHAECRKYIEYAENRERERKKIRREKEYENLKFMANKFL